MEQTILLKKKSKTRKKEYTGITKKKKNVN